jgi:hypothetical protein
MKDRERLLEILNNYRVDYLETILEIFFDEYGDSISARRISGMIDRLNYLLKKRAEQLENAQRIAYERANYIKTYLSGDMWATEEAARANLQPQIDNAQAIIDACKSNSK